MAWRFAWRPFRAVLPKSITVAALLVPLGLTAGCPDPPPYAGIIGDSVGRSLTFFNSLDPANQNATYLTSTACRACHPYTYGLTRLHGHTHALKQIHGVPPEYPAEAERAGVPNPPAGESWTDISYVIGGYAHGAFFVDRDGYRMIDGVNTQWNLSFPPNGTSAGFVAYQAEQQPRLPYDYDCFRCHTVGPQPQEAGDPRSQDSRPGIRGTWAEAGVQCEACHGPGSFHVPNPSARTIFVDSTPQTCARCHTAGDDPNVIRAADGFVSPNTQYAELRASGGHADFNCTVCHNPHASTLYDRSRGIRNNCTACHTDANLAFHDGKVFQRGGYVEAVTCESCHMPFSARSHSVASREVVGENGARVGDVRGHIFRLDTYRRDFTEMFSADGSRVAQDAEGRAAITLDFVCLRCHNTQESIFPLTADGARAIGAGMHRRAAAQ